MGKTFGTVIVMLALPIAVFFGGVWAMSQWSGRQSVPGQMPLNRRWHYDASAVESYWKALSESGFRAEKRLLELDLVFPFFYGGALATGMLLGWAALGRTFSPAWLLAPVAVTILADWTENLVHLRAMSRWIAPDKIAEEAGWVRVATTATTIKLVFFYGSLLTIASLALVLLVRAFRSS